MAAWALSPRRLASGCPGRRRRQRPDWRTFLEASTMLDHEDR
jgi:hypothetical protein